MAEDVSRYSLKTAKEVRASELENIAIEKMGEIVPGVNRPMLQLVRLVWVSLKSAAKEANAPIDPLIDIYLAYANAVSAVNALTTFQQVSDYDPATDPAWP